MPARATLTMGVRVSLVPMQIAWAMVEMTTKGNARARMATYFEHEGANDCAAEAVGPPQNATEIGLAKMYSNVPRIRPQILPIPIDVRETRDEVA